MKHRINLILAVFGLLIALAGCQKESDTTYHAQSLQIDARYAREITFDIIRASIPIKQKRVFIRVDDPVGDVDKHQRALLRELGIPFSNVAYSSPAQNGRHMHLTFADGRQCSFIWVLKHADDRISRIRVEHEKSHALCRISPKDMSRLSERIKQHGFHIDLRDYDEELAATVVEILSLHLLGVPLDEISGSEFVERARDILVAGHVKPGASRAGSRGHP